MQERIRNWWIRWKSMRYLKEAMYGMALNSIGPLYGVSREEGENNRRYERRILKAHMISDRLWIIKDSEVSVDMMEEEEEKDV